ncbi:DUF397 domain-containing protein [Streptomyces sp. H27-C3]|uniref:DUF397 domain-containing protein n=1 Tax=Streptomyces sp. H27-C3 TaxID=3046305 RepID=UPI0024BA5C47|nr:DUF397 domain-containing protein [Streptomyces sp. H27-C3]MDJ0464549.1 DUF397 domain-containing protein [Streptomyces sp. H27-C3]
MSTTELVWFKSTYSGTSGDNCVEVALFWHKSSYSGGDGDSCVEIATRPTTVHIRDSKDKDGPVLTLQPRAWADFLDLATHS